MKRLFPLFFLPLGFAAGCQHTATSHAPYASSQPCETGMCGDGMYSAAGGNPAAMPTMAGYANMPAQAQGMHLPPQWAVGGPQMMPAPSAPAPVSGQFAQPGMLPTQYPPQYPPQFAQQMLGPQPGVVQRAHYPDDMAGPLPPAAPQTPSPQMTAQLPPPRASQGDDLWPAGQSNSSATASHSATTFWPGPQGSATATNVPETRPTVPAQESQVHVAARPTGASQATSGEIPAYRPYPGASVAR